MTNYYPITAAQKMHHNWIMDYGTQQVSGVSGVASVQAEMLADISVLLTETQSALMKLDAVTEEAAGTEEGKVQSEFYHFSVVPAMEGLRTPVDELELMVDKEVWPLPSYGDLLFEVQKIHIKYLQKFKDLRLGKKQKLCYSKSEVLFYIRKFISGYRKPPAGCAL